MNIFFYAFINMSEAEVKKLEAVKRSLAIANRVTSSALAEAKRSSRSMSGGKKRRSRKGSNAATGGAKKKRRSSSKRKRSGGKRRCKK